jgi:hypothetical protein
LEKILEVRPCPFIQKLFLFYQDFIQILYKFYQDFSRLFQRLTLPTYYTFRFYPTLIGIE